MHRLARMSTRSSSASNGKGEFRTESYARDGSDWKRIDTSSANVRGGGSSERSDPAIPGVGSLVVSVKPSLNEPPALWAEDAETGRSRMMWNPNPRLAALQFGRASYFHWTDKTQYEWSGVLIRPVGYVAGRRYPMVIQTYDFLNDEFITDGMSTTAFAARPLASDGLVVLQARKRSDSHEGTAQESLDETAGYESAIERLTSEGPIDPHRVGIIGFSRTAYRHVVESALVEEPAASQRRHWPTGWMRATCSTSCLVATHYDLRMKPSMGRHRSVKA